MKPATLLAAGLLAGLATLAHQDTASAGRHWDYNVSVYSTWAAGVMHVARDSDDTAQYIGCKLVSRSSRDLAITCSAMNTSYKVLTCYTTSTKYRPIVAAISDSSYVKFISIDGECTYIEVDNNSGYMRPPAPSGGGLVLY